jgi:hypothetical protein
MTALFYIAVILLLLGAAIAVLMLREKQRKRGEMQVLLAVMRQVLDDGQEKPQGED